MLGLSTSANEIEVKQQYKILVKLWHPDRHKDDQMKMVAEEKFLEIQTAYEKISDLSARKKIQNMNTPTMP